MIESLPIVVFYMWFVELEEAIRLNTVGGVCSWQRGQQLAWRTQHNYCRQKRNQETSSFPESGKDGGTLKRNVGSLTVDMVKPSPKRGKSGNVITRCSREAGLLPGESLSVRSLTLPLVFNKLRSASACPLYSTNFDRRCIILRRLVVCHGW